ncbi:MAG: hypothetical protein IIY21_28425 [Clostridiales bacterium]|nr:hypothetical protein [Clostridiales bacterium]MBQ1570397.1 hypothetical protein [Clostridiales bacterium]
MIIHITSYTLPEVSAKVVLLNWIEHSNEDTYKRRLARCEVPVLDYQKKWRDYNIMKEKESILCLVESLDAVLDDFKDVYERLNAAYDITDQHEVIRLLNSLYGKNIDTEKLKQKILKHDKKAYESYCKENKVVIDFNNFEKWYRAEQENRRDLKMEEEDVLWGL